MTHTAEVSFFVGIDTAAVQACRSLAQWVALFSLEDDRDVATWRDIYEAIALAHLAGGDFSELIAGPATVDVAE